MPQGTLLKSYRIMLFIRPQLFKGGTAYIFGGATITPASDSVICTLNNRTLVSCIHSPYPVLLWRYILQAVHDSVPTVAHLPLLLNSVQR